MPTELQAFLFAVIAMRCSCGGWLRRKIHPSYFKGTRIVYFCKDCLRLIEPEEEGLYEAKEEITQRYL